jgi:hypothetical protein
MVGSLRVRPVRGVRVLVGVLVLCLLCGCYERVVHGNQSIYRFAWWIGPLVIAAAFVALPLGWILRRWSKKYGFVLMALSPVALVIVAPAMYSDYVLIDDEHFEARYGFWFHPNEQKLRFQDLREVQYVPLRDNRGRIKYELHCIAKSGQMTVVPAGDLVKNTVPEILERARARGVVIVNQPVAP